LSGFYLATAIVLEICGTTSLKLSDGFTRIGPAGAVVVCYAASFALLSLALRGIDLSVAYAVWSGVGTAIVAAIGILWFGEPAGAWKLLSLALIVLGVAGSTCPGVPRNCSAGEDRSAAEKRRQRVGDHIGRDRSEIVAEPPLRFEARTEGRLGKSLTEPRHDPAADIDPAAGAEGQRQIARHRSEHRAEQRSRLGAERIGGADLGVGDLCRGVIQ
jgi:small multidrug resistance pump